MNIEKVEHLDNRLSKLTSFIEKEKVKIEVVEAEKVKLSLSVEDCQKISEVLLQVTELFKNLGGKSEEALLQQLELFVTSGLQAVFGKELKFVVVTQTKGKDVRVEFFIEDDSLRTSIVEARGGGIAEVVSILLQVFFVITGKGSIAPFLLLDTVLVHLSHQYRENVSALLKGISQSLGIQLVLIVNTEEYGYYADTVYKFTQEKGHTIALKEK